MRNLLRVPNGSARPASLSCWRRDTLRPIKPRLIGIKELHAGPCDPEVGCAAARRPLWGACVMREQAAHRMEIQMTLRKALRLMTTVAVLAWGTSPSPAAGHGHVGGGHAGHSGGHPHFGHGGHQFRGGAFFYGPPVYYGYDYDDCGPVRVRRCWRDDDGDRHCRTVVRYSCY